MRTVLALGCGVLLSACSGLSRVVKDPSGPLSVESLVVYPVRYAGPQPAPGRVSTLTAQVLQAALREDGRGFTFVGPEEFAVRRWEDDHAWVASTALPVLLASGGRPDSALVVRVHVEERVTSTLGEAEDAKGRTRGGAGSQESTWVVVGELLHPSSATVLLEARGEAHLSVLELDPTTPDPAPPLTRLLERVTAALVRHAGRFGGERASAPTWRVLPTPRTLLADPEVARAVLGRDALQLELWLEEQAHQLTPALPEPRLSPLAQAPPGLFVLEAAPPLEPEDVIERIDDAPATPAALFRAHRKGKEVVLSLLRHGASRAVVVTP
jgi:hypothetical protein